jgi:hypothetical protein
MLAFPFRRGWLDHISSLPRFFPSFHALPARQTSLLDACLYVCLHVLLLRTAYLPCLSILFAFASVPTFPFLPNCLHFPDSLISFPLLPFSLPDFNFLSACTIILSACLPQSSFPSYLPTLAYMHAFTFLPTCLHPVSCLHACLPAFPFQLACLLSLLSWPICRS